MKKIPKILAALLSAVIFLSSAAVTAAAKQQYYVTPLSTNVNVRSGPGMSYEILGKATYGGKYPYLGLSIDASGTTWYKVRCANSEFDYVWISGDVAHRFPTKLTGDAEPALEDTSGSRINSQVQEIMNETAEKYGASGIQIAVFRGEDGAFFAWNYGYATKNTEAMSEDTKIRVASISKVAVAVAALKMQEQGIVDLDKNIGKYWGEKLPKKVTLKNLLTHTSTLRYLGFRGTAEDTLAQLVNKNNYIDGKPGAKSVWSYNNYAIGVAGTTLEMASGLPLDDYLREEIFSPLGIEASFFSGRLGEDASLATLYEWDGGVERTEAEGREIVGTQEVGRNTSMFSGSLTISAKDTAKLFYLLANNGKYDGERILSSKSVKAMEEQQFRTSEYGGKFYQCVPLRYVKDRYGASKLLYHTGNAYGVIAMASYNPETKDTVVVLTVGAKPTRDKYGVYEVCSSLSKLLYRNMEKLGI